MLEKLEKDWLFGDLDNVRNCIFNDDISIG
jgi:hypothetical protein